MDSLPIAGQQGFEPWLLVLEPFPLPQNALLSPSLGEGCCWTAHQPLLFSATVRQIELESGRDLGNLPVKPLRMTFEGTEFLAEVK